MISVNQLTVAFSGVDLFKKITFLVNPKDRIGLVGKNGAGKSTMLKVLLGDIKPESGSITIGKDSSVGYLAQQMVLQAGKTILEEALSAFSSIHDLTSQLEEINVQLNERTDYESDSYSELIEQLTVISEQLSMMGGNSIEGEAEQTLLGLGFERKDFNRQTTEFSGGWRMRVELAKILLQKPAFMLLDEPTNHLDIESIQWLETFLKNYNGAIVLISHDKAFLDAVTNRTIEISLGRIYDYKASYSKYLVLRADRIAQQTAAYENQQRMIDDTEKFIDRFRYQATKATQVQSRIKQLDKVDRIEIENEDSSSIHFRFPPAPRAGKMVVEAIGCAKSYGTKNILNEVDLVVERGQKIALVGRNGEGKSTLTKMIMSEIEFEGTLRLGHNVRIGYFAQNQDELLDAEKTVFQTLDDVAAGDMRKKVRDILGSFLFSGEDVDKKVRVLSGGERNRLAMAKLLLEPYNLLLLDEPTNHLDIRSKDILKQAVQQYDGTVILVSHDRDFLEGLVTHVYEFKNQRVKEHLGGINDFLLKKKIECLKTIERKDAPLRDSSASSNSSESKASFEDKKFLDKEFKRLSNLVKKAETDISDIEVQLKDVADTLAKPETADASLYTKHQHLEKMLEQALYEWEIVSEELTELQKKRNNS